MTAVARRRLPHAAPHPGPALPSPRGSAPACLAARANVRHGDRLTLVLSLAQSWKWISGIFHLRISISGVYLSCLLPTSEAF